MIGALKTRRMKWTRPHKLAYFKGLNRANQKAGITINGRPMMMVTDLDAKEMMNFSREACCQFLCFPDERPLGWLRDARRRSFGLLSCRQQRSIDISAT